MTWKPTEGLLRASSLAGEIHCVIMEAGGVITPVGRHGMVEMIAKAIDQALRDGTEQDALASVAARDWVANVEEVVPNGMLGDPHPDGATMMGGHPDAEYNKIVDEERRLTADIRAKVGALVAEQKKTEGKRSGKLRRKKAKSKKAAKSASVHSGDNPPTGD